MSESSTPVAHIEQAQPNLADQAIAGPMARRSYGVSGTGIKVGILSDSFNRLGGAATDIVQGLLPADGAMVLQEGPAGHDEGRAIAQLIHATAPGAQLCFYTGIQSEQDFANGILALADAGCQVIVDDLLWVDEPFFQIAGPIDAAVQQVMASGVNYFAAAGNEGANFFEGTFSPDAADIPGVGTVMAEQFSGGGFYETALVGPGAHAMLSLQWTAPYTAANPPALTVYAVAPGGSVTASFQIGQEPEALLYFPLVGTYQGYRIYVAATPGTAAPAYFKAVMIGGTLSGPGVGEGSGSIIGHSLVPGVNAVGAVSVINTPAMGGTPVPEPFSSSGPGALWLAPDGTPLNQPQRLNAPTFLAPDGAFTSVFAPFFGTSAAVAEAAAVAALMLQADPSLSTADVTALLQDSAIPAGATSVAGAGLIQANLAVAYAATHEITGSPQATIRGISQACTITSGAGTHKIVAGSGSALITSRGTDTVVAGAGADTIDLTGASALLFGASGPLLVRAMNGADTVVGCQGSVTVPGGSGGGAEYGGAAGNNLLTAGNTPTRLVQGGAGDTLVAAGGGNDTLFATGAGAATLVGGGANGNVFVASGSGPHLILPGEGTNYVYLDAGADTVIGGAGRLVLQAGSGAQLVSGGAAGGNALLAGSGAATLVAGGAGDTLVAFGAGDLLLAAAAGNDTLVGGTGEESLVGGAGGRNVFIAGAADAVIAPGAADAVVIVGSGQSTIVEGSGTTDLVVAAGWAGGAGFVFGFDPARDRLYLEGYGAGAQAAVAQQYNTGGNSWIRMPDGTILAFVGLAHLDSANVVIA
jgi:Ca2+-binding RTX toxin-like protein